MLRSMMWILPVAWIVGCQSSGSQSLTTANSDGRASAGQRSFSDASYAESRTENPAGERMTAAAYPGGALPGNSIGYHRPSVNPPTIRRLVRRRGG